MRVLLSVVIAVLLGLSVFAAKVIRPQELTGREVVDSYLTVGEGSGHEGVDEVLRAFRAEAQARGLSGFEHASDLLRLDDDSLEAYREAFRAAYESVVGEPVTDTPRLVWSTGPNPARRVQMALFREWHLRKFGEPVDIAADPTNRDLTKSIVQSVAGAGPDLIEYIGASHLRNLVRAGIAKDITEYAEGNGFGIETVFPSVHTSIAVEDESGAMRQYGYPCNLDYKVLLYHKDMFRQAGVPEPVGGWDFEQMKDLGGRVIASENLRSNPQYVLLSLASINAALASGGRLFPEDSATHCVFNTPETVAGIRAVQEMMHQSRVMPRPADIASMSATSAGGFGGLESVSAPGLFARRSTLLHVGGRWEYVVFAMTNRDDVYLPAIDRRLGEVDPESDEAGVLSSARATLVRDVLLPLSESQLSALRGCLTDEDRERLLDIGVAHIPTTTGIPSYSVSARCTVVNRALEKQNPRRLELATRFIEFLGSPEYNEQVNGTFDSICGRIDSCLDEDGIADSPAALPGLEDFDSQVFAESVLEYGSPRELSLYIGRNRLLTLVNEIMEDVRGNSITPEDAALQAEERVNRQVLANLQRDARLRERWIAQTGVDPESIEPGKRGADGRVISIRQQIETGILRAGSGGAS